MLIRSQSHSSSKAVNNRDSLSSMSRTSFQPSKASQRSKLSHTKIKPQFCVTNLGSHSKKCHSKVHLKKQKNYRKRAETVGEDDQIDNALKVTSVLDRYGNKLTKYGIPSRSKIENSLKISQNLSNSNRRADFEN
jgi:hypothetical protein